MTPKKSHSLTRRTLVRIAVTAGVGIVVATCVTYRIVYGAVEKLRSESLSQYVGERVQREQNRFLTAESNLRVFKEAFLQRLRQQARADNREWFNENFARTPDGAMRTRRELVDPLWQSSTWIRRDVPITDEMKQLIQISHELCDQYYSAWRDQFPSLYVSSPLQFNTGIAPMLPEWAWDIAADFDQNVHEWGQLGSPAGNPKRVPLWTGVLFDVSTKQEKRQAFVTLCAPVDVDGRHLLTLHHDLTFEQLLESVLRPEFAAVSHVIFRDDGRLIAHAGLWKEMVASDGKYLLQQSTNAPLRSIFNAVTKQPEMTVSGYDASAGLYFAASRLRGPDWWFVSLLPREQVQAEAFRSAQWVLWIGLATLGFVLGTLAFILRREIARPLAELTQATGQISDGDTSFTLKAYNDDELGQLAASFNLMARSIAERDAALRQEKNSLERRVAERTAELTASESRFRTLVENAPEAIVVLDADTPNGVFVDVNRNAEELFGLSRAELLKVGPADMSPRVQPGGTESVVLAKERISEALRGGTPTFEWTHRTATGKEIACEIRLVQLQSPGRNLVRGSITDITERKRADKRRAIFAGLGQRLSGALTVEQAMQIALEVADELFGWDSCSIDLYSAEQNTAFAVLTMDTIDGRRVPVPPAYAGSAPSPFMQKTIEHGAQLILRKPGERPAGLTPFGDKGRPSASLMFVPMHNGSRVTAILSLQSYTPDAYTPADLQIFQGLADYCSAAVERIQAEQEFRGIFENSLEGICRTTREGRLLAANPAFAQMLGFASPDEVVKSVADIGTHACIEVAQWKNFLVRLAEESDVRQFDTQLRRLNGEIIRVSCSGHAVRDARGNVRYFAITVQDITERKRAEEELLNALAREKELGELKGNFIAMVSHEFRTPLEVILSSADILNRYIDRLAPTERASYLTSIQSSVQRMAGMMEDVLLLGRFERGRLECQPDDLHLAGWCRRLVDEMRSAMSGQCPIEMTLDLADPMARADEKLLRHILTNLISNAVKYSPTGSPVEFKVWRENGSAVFEVKDRGRGIPPTDQPRIFEAFHRARNVGQVPGTGLGLVIVKRGVDLHGGKISLASEEGHGTTFTVWLPLFETHPISV